MVKLAGHMAFALLFAVPAWFLWSRRASAAFAGLAVIASPLPDIDLWLSELFPDAVHHHGVTHTVVFVTVASVIGGGILAGLFTDRLDGWIDGERFSGERLFVFSSAAFLFGGLSHLFADVLSAPDISTPIEPFWPFFDIPVAADVVWYEAYWINVGFLAVMILVHVGLAYVATSRDRSARTTPTD